MPGHPWQGCEGVETVTSAEERNRRTIEGLVSTVGPIVDACHGLAKVGKNGLWSAVVDALGSAIVFQTEFPITPSRVDTLLSLTEAMPAPWRARPIVQAVPTEFGHVCVAQRSGCCLAYTATFPDDHEDDEPHRLFELAFGEPPEAPSYCADCSLRSLEDCVARQVWWRTKEHEDRAGHEQGQTIRPS
jgi:hypothetical protein